MAKAKKGRGEAGFHEWYRAHWGERWSSLCAAFMGESQHVAWWNPHVAMSPQDALSGAATRWLPMDLDGDTSPIQPCWIAPQMESPPVDDLETPAYYLLDGASVLTAAALQVEAGDDVLDTCAAPGGKSLYLAAATGTHGTLVANEPSRNRFERLKNVLHSYMPKAWCQDNLTLTRHDATRWCLYEKDRYDKILLDVPCSSERHVLPSPKALAQWSPARSKQLAVRQYAILASALDVVRIGGLIAYSTCSVSPLECDGVIAKLRKKRAGRFCHEAPIWSQTIGEETEFGWWLLPDRGAAWGPMYVSLLRRIA